jgi:sulfite exporter TauE/SafE
MSWSVIIAGFTLGAAGSLHCVGMCGPLSLALPVHHFSKAGKFAALLLYQFGRIITYTAIGFLFGLAGRQLYIAGYQQWFSIIAGSVILIASVLYFVHKKRIRLSFLNSFYQAVQTIIIKLLRSSSRLPGFLFLGMANGLLPCGMVYIALASSLSFTTITDSTIFMTMFGAGTLPAMLIAGYAGTLLNQRVRYSLKSFTPVFMTIMGALLILRGLNLGIPFISPLMPEAPGTAVVCHP